MHIARLARLGMPEAEVEKFRGQLAQILEAFEILKQVDTTDIPPLPSRSTSTALRPPTR